ncbi:hypothetical protein [Hasllibacter halocynthiae]|uniref:hypothetical protein n=1 Tax=Hasllibacter halocynthiae TaxID=595589 RepID=UPI00147413D8|nr:hypothetical protein [Hasllibacter halocynthiae]
MLKIVTLFLVFMALMAMWGRIWVPGRGVRRVGRCRGCGRLRIGDAGCGCRA